MDDRKQKLLKIILQAVADVCAFPVFMLENSTIRNRDFIDARHIASNCLQEYGFHPTEAATALHRTRVTMLNSKKRYAELYETDADFRRKADEVKSKVAERWANAQKPVMTAQRVTASIIDKNTGKVTELGDLKNVQHSITAPASRSFDDVMREIKRQEQMRQEQRLKALQQKAEHDKRLLHETLSQDAQFSLTYVPYVIAEVAWDYVDCLFDLLIIAHRRETKRLYRAIKEIHKDYERVRFKIIDDEMRKNELYNMRNFVEDKDVKRFFDNLYKDLRSSMTQQYGEIEENSQWIVSTAYVIHIILQAIFRFVEAQEKCVATILGYSISTLPKELRRLDTLILEFAGDMPLKTDEDKAMMKQSIEEFAETISSIKANITD